MFHQQRPKRKKTKHWIKTLMWGQRRQPAEMKVQHLHHCAIMYSKWLHKCFFLSLKEKQTTYLLLRHHLKLACAIHSGCPCKIPKGGKRESNVWGHKKITVTMLPLGLCRFKDRCYIKTARDHVQHQEKALKKIPLHSAPSRFFLCFI